jgi:hypothetical protein
MRAEMALALWCAVCFARPLRAKRAASESHSAPDDGHVVWRLAGRSRAISRSNVTAAGRGKIYAAVFRIGVPEVRQGSSACPIDVIVNSRSSRGDQ